MVSNSVWSWPRIFDGRVFEVLPLLLLLLSKVYVCAGVAKGEEGWVP